ncbi:MAG: hypothetical protein ACRC53_00110 [Plesiomonas sp.]
MSFWKWVFSLAVTTLVVAANVFYSYRANVFLFENALARLQSGGR